MTDTEGSTKRSASAGTASDGFTEEGRAAIRERRLLEPPVFKKVDLTGAFSRVVRERSARVNGRRSAAR